LGWLERVNNVLKVEPEIWFSYLHGQQLEHLKHLKEENTKYRGKFFRILLWGYVLLKNTRFKPYNNDTRYDYLVFAGTVNQKNSLDNTIRALKARGYNVCAVAPRRILKDSEIKNKEYMVMSYSILDVLKSLLIFSFRISSLVKQLKNKDKSLIDLRLDRFLNVYNSLVYFDSLLKRVKPNCIIVSNDHNVFYRALLALGRNSGIKTCYMQHASVSDLFPALNVNYAFLDGLAALKTYRKCESNHPPKSPLIKDRKVFLSGQKKNLTINNFESKTKNSVGIALNSLDSLGGIKRLVHFLCKKNINVRVRWHPGQTQKVIQEIKEELRRYPVEISDPKSESLTEFFADLRCLIAGNSSIHLEAALSHTVPIYYEFSQQDIQDYYGYVKNGLAVLASTEDELLYKIEKINKNELTINKEAVQFYSSTFETEWEGLEGNLVAETLIALMSDKEPPVSCFKL